MVDNTPFSKAELLRRIESGWNDFNPYLDSLTPAQLTQPTDAAGWTAKDHVIHLAVWEGGMVALLNQQPRQEAMGVDEETWRTHDDDKINAVIQQKHKDMPLDEVLKTFRDTHQRLVAKIQSLSDEDLERPYSYYQSHSKRETPVWHFIVGNTYMHYQAHKPWIAAIVSDGQERSE
jgi:uncharacterized protein (TIGR03083 family)